MQIPLQITMRHIARSEALEARIRSKGAKLEELNPNVTGCTVAIEEQGRHQQQGHLFNVRVVVKVPEHEIVVSRDHDEDPNVALRDAFDAVKRQLEEFTRRQRGEVKTHPQVLHGTIARLFADEDYGFIATDDADEYYFSRENVIDPSFQRLQEGMQVQFIPEPVAEGLRAKRVTTT